MTDYVFLTSESFIRDNVNINDNVHSKYIMSALREAQDINLQEILGTRLMVKLQTLVGSGDISKDENADYKLLLDKCQWYLLYQVVTRLCMITGIHISNFGLSQPSDDNMRTLDFKDISQVEQYYQNKADFYKMMLQNWLTENHPKYPELTKNKVSELNSNLYSAASSGVFLGGARGKGKIYNKTHINYDKP